MKPQHSDSAITGNVSAEEIAQWPKIQYIKPSVDVDFQLLVVLNVKTNKQEVIDIDNHKVAHNECK